MTRFMGIKFHCPNGHKLNVKSFLAGRRGVCPHCGARMMIPLESESSRRGGAAAPVGAAAGAAVGSAAGTAIGGLA
ncbi:MAG TPA: hypothetical protein PLV92_25720, partial [Pirellulaceae bacterium]|nr:hypothetical protein [Pirellulaceae bacterium]